MFTLLSILFASIVYAQNITTTPNAPLTPEVSLMPVNSSLTSTEWIHSSKNHTILSTILNQTQTIIQPNTTFFAPSNVAFENLPKWITEFFNTTMQSTSDQMSTSQFTNQPPSRNPSTSQPTTSTPSSSQPSPNTMHSNNSSMQTSPQIQILKSLLAYQTHNGTDITKASFAKIQSNGTAPPPFISTNYKKLNVTLFEAQGTYYVNDAEVETVVIAQDGLVVGINAIITPLFYLQRSIYDLSIYDKDMM